MQREFLKAKVNPITTFFLFPSKLHKHILKDYPSRSMFNKANLFNVLLGKMITRYQFTCFLTTGIAFSCILFVCFCQAYCLISCHIMKTPMRNQWKDYMI